MDRHYRLSFLLDRLRRPSTIKRDDGEHEPAHVCADEVVVAELIAHVQGEGLGLSRDVARDDAHGSELAEDPRRRERDAVGDAPADRGEGDPHESHERSGAKGRRRLFLLCADLLEHGQDLTRDVGDGDERGGEDDAGDRERYLDPP